MIDIKGIPEELKALNQWVCWNEKKVPYVAGTTTKALVNTRSTWTTFNKAVSAYESGKHLGIGFVFTKEDPYCFIDLDHCINGDGINPDKEAHIKALNSWTEISQSGEGIHVICRATQLKNNADIEKGVEVYVFGKYCAMTGNVLKGYPMSIEERQSEVDELITQYFPNPSQPKQLYTPTRYDDDAYKQALKDIPILDVALRLGMELDSTLHGECPRGHPSDGGKCFSINKRGNYWNCFHCEEGGGDTIDLVEDTLKCSFVDAITWLSEQFNIPIQTKKAIKDSKPPDMNPEIPVEDKVKETIRLIHNPKLEKAVLWYLIQPEINTHIIPESIRIFKTENPFFTKLYRQAYDGILDLYRDEKLVSVETIEDYYFSINDTFLTDEQIEKLDNKEKRNDFQITEPKENINHYVSEFEAQAKMLLGLYKKRELQRLGLKMQAYKGTDADDLSSQIHAKLEELDEISRDEDVADFGIGALIKDTTKTLERIANNDGILGISSGFSDLDLYTSGIHKGEMTVIAGRPSMGKSTFACVLAYNMAKEGEKVALISYEMNYASIIHKFIANEMNIDSNLIRNGWAMKDEGLRRKLMNACNDIYTKTKDNLFIIDNYTNEVEVLAEKIAYLADNDGIEVVIIDYMQKLYCKRMRKSGGNREQEVSAISDVLQKLSRKRGESTRKEGIAIIPLAQLSRSCELRPDKRPIKSDLRESGSIEQDADTILFMYRDAEYSGDTSDKSLEVIISKQRAGATGTCHMYYDLATSRITQAMK